MKYQKEYPTASKTRKGKILDELQLLTGNHRKSLIRRLSNPMKLDKAGKRTRKTKYPEVETKQILTLISEVSDFSCAELIHPLIHLYIECLRSNDLLQDFSERDLNLVLNIPLGTLKLKLKGVDKPPYATKSSYYSRSKSQLKKHIPICTDMNLSKEPGHLELDFVDHVSKNLSRGFVRTMCCTDVYSGWISRYAIKGKSFSAVSNAFNYVLNATNNFDIKKLHTDNEPNLLKSMVLQQARKNDLEISRSRSYRKEDNGHVEQKNGDKIRRLVGYRRYDTVEEEKMLCEIYRIDDLYQNYFIGTRKLKAKRRFENSRKVSRIYDEAKTPYQRLLLSDKLSAKQKKKLQAGFRNLNPIELVAQRNLLIKKLREVK